MRSSPQFDIHAMAIFAMFDDVIANMDIDLDKVIAKLQDVARLHARVDGFHADFFQVCFLTKLYWAYLAQIRSTQ